jgi:hypothetical protein
LIPVLVLILLPASVGANSLWSSDCEVMLDPKSIYEVTDTICVTGDLDHTVPGQLFPSAHVYIVKNRVWQLGDHFADHFEDPDLIVSTGGAGAFISEVVQGPPLEPGEYDLILDEYGDGVYTNADLVVGVGTDYALEVVADAFFADGFERGTAPWSHSKGHAYGIEMDGIPVWVERAMAVLNNAVRMAPQEYRDVYMIDHVRSTEGFLLPENYQPVEPLVYLRGLNLAARFHAHDLSTDCETLQHDSCDGTSWTARCNSFVQPTCSCSGEVAMFNFSEPRRQVNIWLCETSGRDCEPDGSPWDNHRTLMMSSAQRCLGVGMVLDFAVQDYSQCRWEFRPPLVDGSHIFFDGEILFMATYFDSPGYPPREVVLVLDGVEHAMDLDIGRPEAGTYGVSIAEINECRSYHFRATTSAGLTYRYPATGQLRTFGDGCTEAWIP